MAEAMNTSPTTTAVRRLLISLPLLALVAAAATAAHLYLHRAAWIEHGESPILWVWTDAVADGRILFAAAQYVAVAAAFALSWASQHCKWRPQRYLLMAWGFTWLPVALIASGDVTASDAGPFNFPMSMFAAPIFGLFCLVELGITLLFSALRTPRRKVNPVAEALAKSGAVDSAQDR